MEVEAVATSKAAEKVVFAREIARALGAHIYGPTLIGTDNTTNHSIGSGVGCPTRSKHFLFKYKSLVQLVSGGEVVLRHMVDAQMAADMLTKWLPGPKLELCLRYICNSW